MGKTRAKKRSSYRYRATGLPSVKEVESEAQKDASVGVKTLPLVGKVSFYFLQGRLAVLLVFTEG